MDYIDQDAISQYITDAFTSLHVLRPDDGPGAGDTLSTTTRNMTAIRATACPSPPSWIVDEANRGRPISAKVASLMQDDCGSAILIFTTDGQLRADVTRACVVPAQSAVVCLRAY